MFNENYAFERSCKKLGKEVNTTCSLYLNKDGEISMVEFIWSDGIDDRHACVNNPKLAEYEEVCGEDDLEYDFEVLLNNAIEIFYKNDRKGLEEICEKLKEGTVKTFCKKKIDQWEVMLPSEKRFSFNENTVRGNVQYEVFIKNGRICKIIQTAYSAYDTKEYYGMSDITKRILKKCYENDNATFRKIYSSLSSSNKEYLFENIIPYDSRYKYKEWKKS